MLEHPFHLVRRRKLPVPNFRFSVVHRLKELVGDDLNRHRKVQRRVLGVRWNLPYSIGIDTGAVYGGPLTAIRLPDETIFQV